MRQGKSFETTCFFEELPLPRIGLIVSKESASFEGYNLFTIHVNYYDMVKFRSAADNGFKRLVGELLRWKSHIGKTIENLP